MDANERTDAARGISLDLTAGAARVVRLHLEGGRLRLVLEADLETIDLQRFGEEAPTPATAPPAHETLGAEVPPPAAGAVPEDLAAGSGLAFAGDAEDEEEELEVAPDQATDWPEDVADKEWEPDVDETDEETAAPRAEPETEPEPEQEEEADEDESFGKMASSFLPALEEAPPATQPEAAEGDAIEQSASGAFAGLEEEEEEPSSLFPDLEDALGAGFEETIEPEAREEEEEDEGAEEPATRAGDDTDLSTTTLHDDTSTAGQSPEAGAPWNEETTAFRDAFAGAEGPATETGENESGEEEGEAGEDFGWLRDVLSEAEREIEPDRDAATEAPALRHGEPAPEPEWAPAMGGDAFADDSAPAATRRGEETAEQESAFPDLAASAGTEALTQEEPDEETDEEEKPPLFPGLGEMEEPEEDETGIFPKAGSAWEEPSGGESEPESSGGDPEAESAAPASAATNGASYQSPSTILERNPFTSETEVGSGSAGSGREAYFQQETILQSARGPSEETDETAPPREETEEASDRVSSGSGVFDPDAFMRKLGAVEEEKPDEEEEEEPPRQKKPTASDSGAFEDTARILRDAASGAERLPGEEPTSEAKEEPSLQPAPLPRSGLGVFETGGAAEAPPPPARPVGMVKYVCPRCKTPGMQRSDKVGAVVSCEKCGKAMKLTLKK